MIWWLVLTYLGGLILILAEFLLPGGICGVIGGMGVLVSVGLAFNYFPESAALIIVGQVAGVIAALILGIKLYPISPVGKAMILADSQDPDEGYTNLATDASLVGQRGEVFSALRPVGTAVIEGKRYQVVSNGTAIEKGASVRVVEVHGNRIVVERDGQD